MDHQWEFKSNYIFYDKEKHGLKNNTVRKIDLNDYRFLELIYWNMKGYNPGQISIKILSVNTDDYFIRDIRDISIYDDIMIITWDHKEGD